MKTENSIALMQKVFGEGVFTDMEIASDWEATLAYCMKRYLTEREYQVMVYRYEENLTFREIGEKFSIGAERTRQIEAKAFRKLKNKGYLLIPKGLHQFIEDEVNKRLEYYISQMNKYAQDYEKLKSLYDGQSPRDIRNTRNLMIPIMDLDFTVRTTNCLRRAGIQTVGDLIQKRENDLKVISNLGSRCLDEIKVKLSELGYSLKED